jgi:hypothetical membrane protein
MGLILKYNWLSVIVFMSFIIIAHSFTTHPYDWKNNTISELAAQGYQYRWLMKIGFILFGVFLNLGITNKIINGDGNLRLELPILIYALAIMVSGLYSTKPFELDVPYSAIESNIHSMAAQSAGIAFSIGILIHGFSESNMTLKLIHFTTFLFVITLSALFGLLESNVGVIQRIMYLGSFIWLVLFYNKTVSI